MEFTKNKIILFIWFWILAFILFIILMIMLFSSWNSSRTKATAWDFKIWLVWDSLENSQSFIDWFKKYASINWNVIIESFDNYEEYSMALSHAISSQTSPDIFVLNNNETRSLFENQVLWISPDIVNVSQFKKDYETFIVDQLVSKTDKWTEFLFWLPVWYETLWIFYNKKMVNSSDLESISSLKSAISRIKERYSDIVPISIWNWTTLDYSEDIATQFLLSEWWDKSISTLSRQAIQKWLASYSYFWDPNLDNSYNSRLSEMSVANQDAVDLFSKWETSMIVWYPKLINKIAEKWFSKNFLFATVFPQESLNSWVALINYNYFVINKDSSNMRLANAFMSYISSQEWIKSYLNSFPYYLPANTIFKEDNDSRQIHSNFSNISIWDFYNDSLTYTSFDKWIKTVYDKEIREILNKENTLIEDFLVFQKSLNCKVWKIFLDWDKFKSCK